MQKDVRSVVKSLDRTLNPYNFLRDARETRTLSNLCEFHRRQIKEKSDQISHIDAAEYLPPVSSEYQQVLSRAVYVGRWYRDELDAIANEKRMGDSPAESFDRKKKLSEDVIKITKEEIDRLQKEEDRLLPSENKIVEMREEKREKREMLNKEVWEHDKQLDMFEKRRVNIVKGIAEGVSSGVFSGSITLLALIAQGTYAPPEMALTAAGVGLLSAVLTRKIVEFANWWGSRGQVYQDIWERA